MRHFSFSRFILCLLSIGFANSERKFKIETLWDGTPVDHKPAELGLSATENGDLQIDVTANFFNSPIPPEPSLHHCPQRSYLGLWNYEVVEAFFLNDNGEYLEVEVSPRGRYIILMFDRYRHDVLHSLKIPEGVEVVNNCWTDGDNESCDEAWTASFVLPKEYLPANVSKFNAYAIHGNPESYGKPVPDKIIYESLYPVDKAEVAEPDFHYLAAFQPINLSDEDIGLEDNEESSDLWISATNPDGEITMEHEMKEQRCIPMLNEDQYSANVMLTKMPQENKVQINFKATDSRGVYPIVSDEYKTSENNKLWPSQESFWISFTNKADEMMRIGVNPFGAHRVHLRESNAWKASHDGSYRNNLRDIELGEDYPDLFSCLATEPDGATDFEFACDFNIPWSFLPPNVTQFQAMHIHKNLRKVDEDDNINPEEMELITAACPGRPEGKIDFKGCEIDARSVTNLEQNIDHSDIWKSIWEIE